MALGIDIAARSKNTNAIGIAKLSLFLPSHKMATVTANAITVSTVSPCRVLSASQYMLR